MDSIKKNNSYSAPLKRAIEIKQIIFILVLVSSLPSYSQEFKIDIKNLRKEFKFKNNAVASWVHYEKRTGYQPKTDTVSLYLFRNKKIKLKYEVVKMSQVNYSYYYFGDSIRYIFRDGDVLKSKTLKVHKSSLNKIKHEASDSPFFKPFKYFLNLYSAKEYSSTDSTYELSYKNINKEAEFTKTYIFSKKDTSLIKLEMHLKPKVGYLSEIYETYTFLNFKKDIEGLTPLAVLPKTIEQKEEADSETSRNTIKINNQFPNIKYATMKGDSIYLNAIKAEYYLLDLWYIGCVPCMKALPELYKLSQKYPYIQLVSINVRNNILSEVAAFVKKNGNESIVLSDTKVIRRLISFYPTFILLDKSLKILDIQSGFSSSGDIKKLEKSIQRLK